MKRLWLILFVMLLSISLAACSKNSGQDLPANSQEQTESDKKAQKCADYIIEIEKFEGYAWTANELKGKINLTVNYMCIIKMYGGRDLKTYYVEYICYITPDGDIDYEQVTDKRLT
jgi:hypothetical protein